MVGKDKLDRLINFRKEIKENVSNKKLKSEFKNKKEDVCKEFHVGLLELEDMMDQRRGELERGCSE